MISPGRLSHLARNWTSAEARRADQRLISPSTAESRARAVGVARPSGDGAGDSFEARWLRWRVEAAAQDALWRRGIIAAVVLLGCGLAAWFGARF